MVRRKLEVVSCDNGYIVTDPALAGWTEVYPSLDAVFARMLDYFEWRKPNGIGAQQGEVVIYRGEKAKDNA